MSESTVAGAVAAEHGAASKDPNLRPCRVKVPAEEKAADLRRQVIAMRWPAEGTVADRFLVPLPQAVADVSMTTATAIGWLAGARG